jgi:hypothetical protein
LIAGILISVALLLTHLTITRAALKEWGKWRAMWSQQNELRRREASADLSRAHGMSGRDFESYVAGIFRESGFHVEPRGGPGDQGCDLLLSNGNERVVCQVKRSARPVSNKAIQEAVAAISFYNANRAMVVTNATFTKGAVELGLANRCELVDRHELHHRVEAFSTRIKLECKNLQRLWAERVAATLIHHGQFKIPLPRGKNATEEARVMKMIVTEYVRIKDIKLANSIRIYAAPSKWVGFIKRPIVLFKAPKES